MRHRAGGYVVVEDDRTLSRHCTEWCAERVAQGYAARRAGPRLRQRAAVEPAVEVRVRSPETPRPKPAAMMTGAFVLTLLLWALIAGVVVLIVELVR